MSDPPASDLGAIAEVCAMLRGIAAEWVMLESVDVPPTALLAVLDHVDAQAARLAALETFLRAVQHHGWDAACEVLGDPLGAGEAGEARDGE